MNNIKAAIVSRWLDFKNHTNWWVALILYAYLMITCLVCSVTLFSMVMTTIGFVIFLVYAYADNKYFHIHIPKKKKFISKYLTDVELFHKTFGQVINDKSGNVDLKTRQLRVKLLFEENEELAEASDVKGTFEELCLEFLASKKKSAPDYKDGDNVDVVEELDALCDIQYVLSGAVLALGHHKNFDAAFQNIQDSNMSKGCKTKQEADDTQKHYLDQGVESYVVDKDGILIVLRKEDDKVLKNSHYTPTNLKQFV